MNYVCILISFLHKVFSYFLAGRRERRRLKKEAELAKKQNKSLSEVIKKSNHQPELVKKSNRKMVEKNLRDRPWLNDYRPKHKKSYNFRNKEKRHEHNHRYKNNCCRGVENSATSSSLRNDNYDSDAHSCKLVIYY